jgi:phosphate transport system permease protein
VQGAGLVVLLLLVAIGVFLGLRAIDAFRSQGLGFFTHFDWLEYNKPPVLGIAALAFGTVVSSLLALVLAVPVAIGTALLMTEVLPLRLGRLLGYMVDLLAAVPSVVYGLWGLLVLVPFLNPVERFLDRWLGWIPIFDNRTGSYGRTIFAGAVVLAIMVVPIVAALAREIFKQVPRSHREAAQALGATPWETMRIAVLPYSRTGLVGATMLGFGRALGETIAVALVLGSAYVVNPHITETGGNSIAANIAIKFGEAGPLGRSSLIASGLVLFAITLVVNLAGRAVVRRGARV